MNYGRLVLASLGATVAYFVVGGLLFGLIPTLRDEFRKYPEIYRTQDEIKAVMPAGMVAMLLAIASLAVIYALGYRGEPGLFAGARFGVLVGIFAIGSFVIHNYVNLKIGPGITVQQSVAYFAEWTVVGVVIGLIYKPA